MMFCSDLHQLKRFFLPYITEFNCEKLSTRVDLKAGTWLGAIHSHQVACRGHTLAHHKVPPSKQWWTQRDNNRDDDDDEDNVDDRWWCWGGCGLRNDNAVQEQNNAAVSPSCTCDLLPACMLSNPDFSSWFRFWINGWIVICPFFF